MKATLKTPHEVPPGQPPWMQGFAKLSQLHGETKHVQDRVDQAFEEIEADDRS